MLYNASRRKIYKQLVETTTKRPAHNTANSSRTLFLKHTQC